MVYNIGVNDAGYKIVKYDNEGNQIEKCPYYQKWVSMLARCYSKSYLKHKPTYIACSVCEEWLTFSNFKSWMEQQDWEGKALDKDLLVYQNKIYSPETCCFVSTHINGFLTKRGANRGKYPMGVTYHKRSGMFYGQVSLKTSTTNYIGSFSTPQEAHREWQKAKFTQAFELASQETGVVQQGLLRAANKIKDDYDNNLETKDY